MWPGIGWALGYSGCKLMAKYSWQMNHWIGSIESIQWLVNPTMMWQRWQPSLSEAAKTFIVVRRHCTESIFKLWNCRCGKTVLWNHFLQMYKAHGSPRCNACVFPSIVTRVFQMLSVWDTSRPTISEQKFWLQPGLSSTSRRLWSLTSCSKAIWDMATEAKSPRRVCSHAHLEENDGLRKTVSFNKRRFDPGRLGWSWLMDGKKLWMC